MELPMIKLSIEDLEAETCGRYEFLGVIGRGSYGVVLSARDKETNQKVAIKRLQRIFSTVTDAKRVLREIRILSNLRNENIINIIDIVSVPDFSQFVTLIVVMDLMDTDLAKIISSRSPLNVEYRKFFAYQIVRGLKYVHSACILHRDLKPSNILLNSNCDLKIADFGLARVLEETGEQLSEYVATRWYRAPEILLNYDTYGPSIDVWSTGCILAEILLMRPLFPGNGTLHQLQLISDVLGSPTDEDLEELKNMKARQFMESLPPKEPADWLTILVGAGEDEIDFISRMITWDSRKRMTINEALEHPYLEDLHDPVDEPSAFPLDNFEFENELIGIDDVKKLLWKEVMRFHPDFPPAE